MTFSLGDDGTMDTVVFCDVCGQEERYSFDGCKACDDGHDGAECYNKFIRWAQADANELHECEASA